MTVRILFLFRLRRPPVLYNIILKAHMICAWRDGGCGQPRAGVCYAQHKLHACDVNYVRPPNCETFTLAILCNFAWPFLREKKSRPYTYIMHIKYMCMYVCMQVVIFLSFINEIRQEKLSACAHMAPEDRLSTVAQGLQIYT